MSHHNSPHALHRALLTPFVLTTLRATGFHSTRPAVLDTLVDLAERYLVLLATSTADFAFLHHNTPVPTVTDVRMAMEEHGAIVPRRGAAEEWWREILRRDRPSLGAEGGGAGGGGGAEAEGEGEGQAGGQGQGQGMAGNAGRRRRRDDRDLEGVEAFTRWFDGREYAEVLRVAGANAAGDAGAGTGAGAAKIGGVGAAGEGARRRRRGGEDVLTQLKKRYVKMGGDEEARWVGTVLGKRARSEDGEDGAAVGSGGVWVEGGPVQRIADWRPPMSAERRTEAVVAAAVEAPVDDTEAVEEVRGGGEAGAESKTSKEREAAAD